MGVRSRIDILYVLTPLSGSLLPENTTRYVQLNEPYLLCLNVILVGSVVINGQFRSIHSVSLPTHSTLKYCNEKTKCYNESCPFFIDCL